MILVFRRGCTKNEVTHAEERLQALGLEPHTLFGVERTVIAAIGDERVTSVEELSSIPGVEKVLPILAPYKLASREVTSTPSIFEIGGDERENKSRANKVAFGGKFIPIIAGPCSVESRSQILETARAVKDAGASALRAGAFKPRTSPYQFQGLAEEGLEYLAEARAITGLPVVTEVMTPTDVSLVAKYADCLQIGTRNMQNFPLLRACGLVNTPILLKRGMSATLEEYLLAAEYILTNGNQQVLLCERGIRTFEQHVRNTFALSIIPALKERTHLPVLADPSHGTGARSLVAPMTRAAIACGADGILIEVAIDPEKALTDSAQTISVKDFEILMKECRAVAEAIGRAM